MKTAIFRPIFHSGKSRNLFVCAILAAVFTFPATAQECPLCDAAKNGNIAEIRRLLDSGANINAENKFGDTALILAAWKGYTEIAKILLDNGANVNVADNYDWTALILAAKEGHTEIAKILLDNGANLNAANNDGDTALIRAAWKGHTEIAKILLDNGVNLNAANNDGETALILATWEGHTKIAKILLDNGANVNVADNYGWTALIRAAQKDHTETVNMLLDNGANPDLANENGETVWDIIENKPLMKALFQQTISEKYGVNIQQRQNQTTAAEKVFENAWRSVVVIRTANGQGSGVIIRPNIVATNCHVLDGGGKITIYKHDNRRASTDTLFYATLRKRDSENDFCLLDVSGLWGIPANIRRYNTLKIGESVYALGSPESLDLSLSSGLISQLRRGKTARYIQTDAAISPGSSGGGLFDSEGNLIGILTSKIADEDVEGIGFAIPADLALDL